MSEETARRAVDSQHWRWMPGMLTQHGRICGAGYLVTDDVDEGGQPYVDCTDTIDDWSGLLPDLSDPATLGCLLALVREAVEPQRAPGEWPVVCTYQSQGKKWGVGAWLNESGKATFAELVLPTYETEAAALVAALEAAP